LILLTEIKHKRMTRRRKRQKDKYSNSAAIRAYFHWQKMVVGIKLNLMPFSAYYQRQFRNSRRKPTRRKTPTIPGDTNKPFIWHSAAVFDTRM